jgi:hypothetical protein
MPLIPAREAVLHPRVHLAPVAARMRRAWSSRGVVACADGARLERDIGGAQRRVTKIAEAVLGVMGVDS